MESKLSQNVNIRIPEIEHILKTNQVNQISNVMKQDISNTDLERYLGKETLSNDFILKYSELKNYKTIEELLPKDFSYKIILIESEMNSGHWICLLRYGNFIEIFNSYGTRPSVELNFLSRVKKMILGQDEKFLNTILTECKGRYKVIYNKKRFQKYSNNIRTCGRHVLLRIMMNTLYRMTLMDYIDFMEKIKERYGLDYDQIVSVMIK